MKLAMLALVGLMFANPVLAEDSVKENAKEAAHDAKVGMKKAGRKAKDETCEMVNGKMECAAKKAGHKVENAVDDVKK